LVTGGTAKMKTKSISKKPASKSEIAFTRFAYVFMSILALLCILPCLHVISKSISGGDFVTAGKVFFWPRQIQFEAVEYILFKTSFFDCLKNTLIVTIVGTLISMFSTITTAYPLSKPSMPGRKLFVLLYVFSMVFFGGIVPAYMVVNTLGLLDTYWGVILPFAIVQFNMFVMKSYFEGLPESIEEAAHIDGAGDIQTLVLIVIPMSKPVIATVSLLYAVNYWNNYFHAMMYTSSESMKTLQVYLYDIINNGQAFLENLYSGAMGANLGNTMQNITTDGMISAAVTLSIIPIVLVYPFVQRFMIQGITIGSVKG
jgi:ABC-type sugar transport system, permease component